MEANERVSVSDGKALIRNTVINFSGQAIPLIVAVLAVPYIIDKLGTDEFGILTLVWMVLSCFSLFDLGLGRATVKYVSEFAGSRRTEQIPNIIWTSVCIQIVLGCVVALISAAIIPFAVERLLKVPPTLVRDAINSFLIVAASVPFLLVGNTFRGVLEAAQRFDLINYIRVPSGVLTVLLAAVGAACGLHITGIMLLIFPARVAAAFGYMVLSFRTFPILRRKILFDRSVVRQLSTFGGWVMVSNIASPTLAYLERLLIASLLSVSALAFYAAPGDLIGRLAVFPISVGMTLFPFFSFHGSDGVETVSRVSSKTLRYLLLLIVPIVAAFTIYAHEILFLWLGAAFAQQSTMVLQILALSLLFNVLTYIPYNSVHALGRPDLKALLDIFEVLFFAALAWVSIRHMGIDGAALAKLAVTLVDTAGLFWAAKSIGAFSFREFLSGPLLRTYSLGVALFVSVFVLKQTVASPPVSLAFLACLFSGYGFAAWRLGFDESEKVLVRELLLQFSIVR